MTCQQRIPLRRAKSAGAGQAGEQADVQTLPLRGFSGLGFAQ